MTTSRRRHPCRSLTEVVASAFVESFLGPAFVAAAFCAATACAEQRGCEYTLTCPEVDAGRRQIAEAKDDDATGDMDTAAVVIPVVAITGLDDDSDAGDPAPSTGSDGGMDAIQVTITATRCREGNTAACTGDTPYCNTEIDVCVTCFLAADTGCPSERPLCIPTDNDVNACVECAGLEECGGVEPICTASGDCVGCESHDDCEVFPGAPRCRDDGQCAQCAVDEDCGAASPVCDDGVCMGCNDALDCNHLMDTPACNEETGSCVQCISDSDCEDSGAPRCEANECTECADDEDCGSHGELAHCDPSSGACAQCVTDEQCPSSTASSCVDNECVGCTTDAHCDHLNWPAVCDEEAAECVQCTADKEWTCGNGACDPATRACTTVPRGSIGICGACVADSQCVGGDQAQPIARCVPMEHDGLPRPGGYCLRRETEGCQSNVFTTLLTAESLSGASPELYCGIRQDVVTCEAVVDLTEDVECPFQDDRECGCQRDAYGTCLAPGVGGVCAEVSGEPYRCTYPCDNSTQCPIGLTCNTTSFRCN
jgi:hypothetical protein